MEIPAQPRDGVKCHNTREQCGLDVAKSLVEGAGDHRLQASDLYLLVRGLEDLPTRPSESPYLGAFATESSEDPDGTPSDEGSCFVSAFR